MLLLMMPSLWLDGDTSIFGLEHPKRREINAHHRVGTLCLEEIFGLWEAMLPGSHLEVSLADALDVAQKSRQLLHAMAEEKMGSTVPQRPGWLCQRLGLDGRLAKG